MTYLRYKVWELGSTQEVREGGALLVRGALHFPQSPEGCLDEGRLQPQLAGFSHNKTLFGVPKFNLPRGGDIPGPIEFFPRSSLGRQVLSLWSLVKVWLIEATSLPHIKSIPFHPPRGISVPRRPPSLSLCSSSLGLEIIAWLSFT